MGTIILGAVILLVAFVVRTAGSSLRTAEDAPAERW